MFKALRSRAGKGFNTRSAGRDVQTDTSRLDAIHRSIESALRGATAEREGLDRRIADILARAGVTQGNDSDEYLMRDPRDDHNQNIFNQQIAEGECRLLKLSKDIEGFRRLKHVFEDTFPQLGDQLPK